MATQNNDGRGEVQNPDTDSRLKENRGGQQASGQSGDDNQESGGQGRVKDAENDGRLKENR